MLNANGFVVGHTIAENRRILLMMLWPSSLTTVYGLFRLCVRPSPSEPPSLAALAAPIPLPQTPQRSLGKPVEKEVDGGDLPFPGDEEIGPWIFGRLARDT
jgi:hypothetical protein